MKIGKISCAFLLGTIYTVSASASPSAEGQPADSSADNGSQQSGIFYGYTPAETRQWVDKAPDAPPEGFSVVAGAGAEGNAQCALMASSEQLAIDTKYLRRAIKLASHNPVQAMNGEAPDGGLFGALLYKDGKILGEGWNTVLKEGDPSRHAEMNAIRQATHDNGYGLEDLAGATLYTSGAPCPMCYSTMAWANIGRIVYASDYSDAMTYGGFKDEPIRASFEQQIHERHWPGCQHESGLGRAWWQVYDAHVYKGGQGAKY